MCDDQIYFINGVWVYYDLSQASSLGTPLVPLGEPVRRIKPDVLKVGSENDFSYYCDFNSTQKFDRVKETLLCTSEGWRLVPRN